MKVLKENGQYTEEFMELMDSMQPEANRMVAKLRDWLTENESSGLDRRIACDILPWYLFRSGLDSLWVDWFEEYEAKKEAKE